LDSEFKSIISEQLEATTKNNTLKYFIEFLSHFIFSDTYSHFTLSICRLKNLYGKFDHEKDTKDNKLQAFRTAINNTKRRRYFEDHCLIEDYEQFTLCENCGKKQKKKYMTVDHHEMPFQKILDDFLILNNYNLENIQCIEKNNCMKFVDDNLKTEWIQYHDKTAKFRVLCKPCNGSCGSYGYRALQ
jgi:hypothetical protein